MPQDDIAYRLAANPLLGMGLGLLSGANPGEGMASGIQRAAEARTLYEKLLDERRQREAAAQLGETIGATNPLAAQALAAGQPGIAAAAMKAAPLGYEMSETGETLTPRQGEDKPIPTRALTLQDEILGDLETASSVSADMKRYRDMIESGKLALSPINNLEAKARNLVGESTSQSRNFSSFTADLERLRNNSLRLNKGTQTEGDANRAWNELLASPNDQENVKQRLAEIEQYNQRAFEFKKNRLQQLRAEYGKGPIDTSPYEAKPIEGAGGGPQGGSSIPDPVENLSGALGFGDAVPAAQPVAEGTIVISKDGSGKKQVFRGGAWQPYNP